MPGTTWTSHIIAFLLKISYSQIAFVRMPHLKVFLGKFGPKNWSSPNWLKVGTGLHCYTLITILMSIFQNFVIQKHWTNLISKSNVLQIDARAHCSMLITVFMCNFSKYLLINFWGKFHPKICCSPHLLKFSIDIRFVSVNFEKTRLN